MGIGGSHPVPEPAQGTAGNGRPRESVWDYPRPPRLEPVDRRVRVALGGEEIVDSMDAVRVLETAGAPVVYVHFDEVLTGSLRPAGGASICEWKGNASYFDVHAGDQVADRAAFTYRRPNGPYVALTDFVSFYPALVECRLDDEIVMPQPGGFYGGWVTAEITGPIKGHPGSGNW